jgi:hypothetical protein
LGALSVASPSASAQGWTELPRQGAPPALLGEAAHFFDDLMAAALSR